MADGCHVENQFLAMSQQPIARFQCNFAWGIDFSQNFGNGTNTRVLQNVISSFSDAVWTSASGAFRIVSDTLVL